MPQPRTTPLIACIVAAAFGLTACAGDVPMEAATHSNDPACANVSVRLPRTVAGLHQRTTNAQATGAWGDNVGVQLRCGIETSGPTTDSCIEVDGVDWIMDDSAAPLYRFEAYGRSPGLEVYVNSELASGTSAIVDLGTVARLLPQKHECTGPVNTLNLDK